MITITPSILVKTAEEFKNQVNGLGDSVSLIQLDITDGKFVPNTTWADPEVVKNNCDLDIELHLMVSDPLAELKKWLEVKQIKRVLIHYEAVPDFREIIFEIQNNYDWQIGVVINPETDYSLVEPYLNEIDSVMFMGVIPGKQGQDLIPEVLQKITDFTIENPDVYTELDGAVNTKNMEKIIKSGVKAICPGSAVFGNEKPPAENIKNIENLINSLTQS